MGSEPGDTAALAGTARSGPAVHHVRAVTAMSTPTTAPIVSVVELLGRPGASRPVDLELAAPEGLALPLVEIDQPLRLVGVLESVVDGILVRGELDLGLRMSCARCLQPVQQAVQADVVELFNDPDDAEHPDDVEPGYEIRDCAIDLDTLLRDVVVPAVPVAPKCREDCAGLCPTCGVDRNEVGCDCADEVQDDRWAALEGLSLPDHRTG